MRPVVCDTNVLVSGFRDFAHPERAPGKILRLWSQGLFELILSPHLLSEVTATFRNPYFRTHLTEAQRSRALHLLRHRARLVAITVQVQGVATHQEDDLTLATAVSTQPTYLVTGDKKLQQLRHYQQVTIVSPHEFLAILEQEAGDEAA